MFLEVEVGYVGAIAILLRLGAAVGILAVGARLGGVAQW
jgi:hypothetical protein